MAETPPPGAPPPPPPPGGPSGPRQPQRPLDTVNVYGDTINVTYKDGGPKPGNQTGANDQQKPLKEISKGQDEQTAKLEDALDKLAEKIAKAIANLRTEGGGSAPAPTGAEKAAADTRTRETYKQAQLIEALAGRKLERLSKVADQASEEFDTFLDSLMSVDDFIGRSLLSGFQGLKDALSNARQQLINFAGDLMSGQYAINYFTDMFSKAMEANSRGMSTFYEMMENIFEGGVSIADTIDSIREDMADGGNAYAMSAMSAKEYGKALAKQRDNLQNLAPDVDAMLDFKEQNMLLQNVYEQMVRMGISADITDDKVAQMSAWQFNVFKDIARATGRSMEELIKMNKKAPISITEAIAQGRYSEEEGKKILAMYQRLLAADPSGKTAEKFARHVADPTHGFDGTYTPAEMAAGMREYFEGLLQGTLAGDGSAESDLDVIRRQAKAAKERGTSYGGALNLSGFLGPDSDWVSSSAATEQAAKKQLERLEYLKKHPIEARLETINNTIKEWLSKNEWIKGVLAVISGIIAGGTLILHTHAMWAHTKALTLASIGGPAGSGGLWGLMKTAFGSIPRAAASFTMIGLAIGAIFKFVDPARLSRLTNSFRDFVGHLFDSAGGLLAAGLGAMVAAVFAPVAVGTLIGAALGGALYEAIDYLYDGEMSKFAKQFGQWVYDFFAWVFENAVGGFAGLGEKFTKEAKSWWDWMTGDEKPDTGSTAPKKKPIVKSETMSDDLPSAGRPDPFNMSGKSRDSDVLTRIADILASIDGKTRRPAARHDTY